MKYEIKVIECVGTFGVWEVRGMEKVTFFKSFDTKRKAENYIKKVWGKR